MPGKLILQRGIYRRYPKPLAPQETPFAVMRDWLCDELADMSTAACAGLRQHDIAGHIVCSTGIDRPFAGGLYDWSAMRERMASRSRLVPDTVINAYECASWGYSLRHVLRARRSVQYVVIHIADVNVLNLDMWVANENWGDSGFGIASLLFRVEGTSSDVQITTGASKTGQRVPEFVMDVRKEVLRRDPIPVALPFFPAHVTEVLDRSLAGVPRLADLHPQYGHCFGSDPWLAIIHDMCRQRAEPRRYLATSIALIGYWTIAEVETCADGDYRIEEKLT